MKKANWVETQLALVCLLNMTLSILFYFLTELHLESHHLSFRPPVLASIRENHSR
jgi:hypothetical protein